MTTGSTWGYPWDSNWYLSMVGTRYVLPQYSDTERIDYIANINDKMMFMLDYGIKTTRVTPQLQV